MTKINLNFPISFLSHAGDPITEEDWHGSNPPFSYQDYPPLEDNELILDSPNTASSAYHASAPFGNTSFNAPESGIIENNPEWKEEKSFFQEIPIR